MDPDFRVTIFHKISIMVYLIISLYHFDFHENTLNKFYGYIFINIYIFGKIFHKIYLWDI